MDDILIHWSNTGPIPEKFGEADFSYGHTNLWNTWARI